MRLLDYMDTNKNKQMKNFDTLSEAIKYLNHQGYIEQFISNEHGIKGVETDMYFPVNELQIVANYRFEGMSNPADSSQLFAIESNNGVKGTLVMSYGAEHFQNVDNIKMLDNHPRIDD